MHLSAVVMKRSWQLYQGPDLCKSHAANVGVLDSLPFMSVSFACGYEQVVLARGKLVVFHFQSPSNLTSAWPRI